MKAIHMWILGKKIVFILIYLLFCSIVLFAGHIYFNKFSADMQDELGNKAQIAAISIAGSFNLNDAEYERLLSLDFNQLLKDPVNQEFEHKARAIMKDTDIKYIYLESPLEARYVKYKVEKEEEKDYGLSEGTKLEVAYVLDAVVSDEVRNEDTEGKGYSDKDRYTPIYEERKQLYQNPVAQVIYNEDEWGTYLTGYAPYYTKEGKLIGMIGADLFLDNYSSFINRSFIITLIFCIILCIFGFGIMYFIYSRIRDTLYTDAMTGLYSRRYYREEVQKLITKQPNTIGTMIFVNIRNFRKINETFGQNAVDKIIIDIADRLNKLKNRNVVIAHIAADEFAIYYHHEDKQEIEKVANELLGLLSAPYSIDQNEEKVEFVLGISIYGEDASDAEVLAEHAEFALAEVKKVEGENIGFYNADNYMAFKKAIGRRQKLPQMIKDNAFYSVFQPIIDLKAAEIYGYEGLSRLKDASYGNIFETVQDARNMGIIDKLDTVLTRNIASEFNDSGLPGILFINQSPSFMPTEVKFKELVSPLQGKKFFIEITEYESLNFEQVEHKIDMIRSMGGLIAIDDFGSGYANELALLAMNPDLIKIDRGIVSNIDSDENKQILVENIIRFAATNGIKVLAEGIETSRELKVLMELGVDLGQGFYFARPDKNPPLLSDALKNEINDNLHAWIIEVKKAANEGGRISVADIAKRENRSLISRTLSKLYGAEQINNNIQEIIEDIGVTIGVSRVYIFEEIDDGQACSIIYEWCDQEIGNLIQKLRYLPYSDLPGFKDLLERDGMIFAESVEDLPGNIKITFQDHQVKSLLILPLYVRNKFFGFMGFDECKRNRIWTSKEVNLLYQISCVVSYAVASSYLAFHDYLTGLYNRKYFEAELKRLDVSRQLPITLILGDLSNLKEVNDKLGIEKGDKLLVESAKVISRNFRIEDIICRISGNEFAIILPKTKKIDGQVVARRIINECSTENIDGLGIQMAMGVATKTDIDQEIWEVYKEALRNMNNNKA